MQANSLETFNPRYFSLTMATGIVAIALRLNQQTGLSIVFDGLTLLSWLLLFVLYVWRLVRYPRAVLEDLQDPVTTFSFFTFVAATNVCGLILLNSGLPTLAAAAWITAFFYWAALMYFSFAALSFSHPAPTPSIVDGGWLILIVGTQSLVLLGVELAPHLGAFAEAMLVEATLLWCLGMVFYGIFVTLFCYRIFFTRSGTDDFSPLFWVVMGAAAISANAGSSLYLAAPSLVLLEQLKAVILLADLLWWTWASWWIPMLVIFGIWKHGYHSEPLRYTPALWNMVFPMGMYAVATNKLAHAADLSPLLYLSRAMLWIAVMSWVVVTVFLTRQLREQFRSSRL